ncbi:MAG: glycine/sarcosine/betaine reductase selenoprotein B family protein [Acidimicrobiales bacterium]
MIIVRLSDEEAPMSGDVAMRDLGASLPVPEFDAPTLVSPPPLDEATVAIVTSAALHRPDGDQAFTAGDTSYRLLDRSERELVLGHWSPNFDRTGIAIDLNVVYPIDRLEELASAGVIGAVAPRHVSFAGNQPDDVATIRHDSGPAAAAELVADGVDVVILTPV